MAESDFDLLERLNRRFHIVHSPRSHDYFGHSRFPFEKLRALGFNICLGTDSLASNESLSLFAEMRAFQRSEPGISPDKVLEMVTVNPALALDQSRHGGKLGRIRPGFQADLIAVPCSGDDNLFEQILAFDGPVDWMLLDGKTASGTFLLLLTSPVNATKRKTPSTREMERINWIEFREWVPAKIRTVLLPLGTLEPHGVAPNGTDILAPVAMAREIAPRVNALVAPAIPYGFTGIMDAYPGSFTIPEAAFRGYVRAVLAGLAKNKFKNIILLNGHGGGQTAVLSALAQEVGRETGTRILVVNWWSYCSDVTLEVFGEDGGHGAENETAYIMAIDPALVQTKAL